MSEPHIRFENVSKSFGDHVILDDVSFEVPRSRAFCLLGRSGVGKSVTLRLLCGLVRVDRGRISVAGDDISDLSGRALVTARRRMGFLFQKAALFDSISLGENIAFPLRRHAELGPAAIRERAQEKLAQVGLDGHYDKMPAALSGGMAKRAGLARALALDPDVLLVDEPSAGLDPITSTEIDELLLELKSQGGTTMVVVTHNIPSARRVGDRLAILERGKILAEGTAAELDHHDDELVQQFLSSTIGG